MWYLYTRDISSAKTSRMSRKVNVCFLALSRRVSIPVTTGGRFSSFICVLLGLTCLGCGVALEVFWMGISWVVCLEFH